MTLLRFLWFGLRIGLRSSFVVGTIQLLRRHTAREKIHNAELFLLYRWVNYLYLAKLLLFRLFVSTVLEKPLNCSLLVFLFFLTLLLGFRRNLLFDFSLLLGLLSSSKSNFLLLHFLSQFFIVVLTLFWSFRVSIVILTRKIILFPVTIVALYC